MRTFKTLCGLLAAVLVIGLLSSTGNAAPPLFEQTDVFVFGEGGYFGYRIPALVVSKKGTVLAFCEARKSSFSDEGDIDLVLRRSFDGGKSFEPTQLVHEEGGTAEITIGNPCPVVDAEGTIHLLFARNNRRAFYAKSTDDGATFSAPVEITRTFHGFDDVFKWGRLATGPVHGIQTRSGRIVIPVWLNDRMGHDYRSAVIYSDDSGSTWTAGGVVPPMLKRCNECTVVEIADGRLLLNMRNSSGNCRGVAQSSDGGVSWAPPEQIDQLVCPVCQAAVVRFTRADGDGKNRMLFCNPASRSKRDQMTLRLSYDEGRTWPVAKLIDGGPSFGYCDLAVSRDGIILCFYESSKKHSLILARCNLEWLTDGKDRADPQKAVPRIEASRNPQAAHFARAVRLHWGAFRLNPHLGGLFL